MTPAVFFLKKMELFLKSVLLFSNGNCFPSSSKNCKLENRMFSLSCTLTYSVLLFSQIIVLLTTHLSFNSI